MSTMVGCQCYIQSSQFARELTEILETDWNTVQWALELICRGKMSIELSSRLQRI